MEMRKRPRQKRVWIVLAVLCLTFILCYAYINSQLQPALREIAGVRVNALVSDAMYSSVLDLMAQGALDDPFMHVQTETGQVYYTELNNRVLTKFAADCAQLAQERLIAYGKQGIKIPVGTVSGMSILAGTGPDLNMTFYPETNTQAFFSSEFRSAGINQTLHRVMLRLEAQVAVTLPGSTQVIVSFVDVPVAEQIIVGQVPQTYADLNLNKDALNLVPQQ